MVCYCTKSVTCEECKLEPLDALDSKKDANVITRRAGIVIGQGVTVHFWCINHIECSNKMCTDNICTQYSNTFSHYW